MIKSHTVPKEIFVALLEQHSLLLETLAALLLTEEEVALCRTAQGQEPPTYDWAKTMREDLLGKREQLVKILKKNEFPTNTHSWFIIGAFQCPEITLELASRAENLRVMTDELASGAPTGDLREALLKGGASPEDADYLLELMASRIAWAELQALVKNSKA